jgi:hypothetical protein
VAKKSPWALLITTAIAKMSKRLMSGLANSAVSISHYRVATRCVNVRMSIVCVVLMSCRILAPMLAVELDSYFRDRMSKAALAVVHSRIRLRFRLSQLSIMYHAPQRPDGSIWLWHLRCPSRSHRPQRRWGMRLVQTRFPRILSLFM